eukprot:3678275-Amphidinium_carterae.1
MASHPELSFLEVGITGIPSRVVVPSSWHHWHPIQSCRSLKFATMASHPELSFQRGTIFCLSSINSSWFMFDMFKMFNPSGVFGE